MNASELYSEAKRRGLKLELRGDKLAVIPGKDCPPDLAERLRQAKGEIMALLDAKAKGLPLDCAPWLYIAQQILAGEFDGANRSTVESLTMGLRSIAHPRCHLAMSRLRAKPR